MKRNILIRSLALCCLLLIALLVGVIGREQRKSSGAHPGTTGAPGEATCSQAGCHSDATVAKGDGINTLLFNDAKKTNYLADSVYELTVRVEDATAKRFGFEIVALDATGRNAGTFLKTFGTVIPRTQVLTNASKLYVTHISSSVKPVSPGLNEWKFNWQAPATNKGPITFYYATNCANADNSEFGDKVYLSSSVMQAETSAGISNRVEDEKLGVRVSEDKLLSIEVPHSLLGASVQLRIFSSNGQCLLWEQKEPGTDGHLQVQLPSSCARGVYVVEVATNSARAHQHIVVQ